MIKSKYVHFVCFLPTVDLGRNVEILVIYGQFERIKKLRKSLMKVGLKFI